MIQGLRRGDQLLTLLLAVLMALGIAVGLAGTLAISDRAELLGASEGRTMAEPGTRQSPFGAALTVYVSVADADTSAASAFFLQTGTADLRARYRIDVAQATAALTSVAGSTASSAIADLSTNLPVYSGQVEDAVLARNRPGLSPELAALVGATHLREPAVRARETILPAAKRLADEETGRLADAQDEAGSLPWFTLGLGVVLIGCLLAAQIYLWRRTRRLLNLGLMIATAATLAAIVLLSVASGGAAAHTDRAATERVAALAEARIAGMQARADEIMTTLESDNEPSYFDQRFATTAARLSGMLTDAGQPEVREVFQKWLSAHRARTDPGDLASKFDSLVGQSLNEASARLDEDARAARAALSGVDSWVTVLMGLAVLAVLVGMWPRIAEYR